MLSEDTSDDESDLRRVVESLLRSRPDLADPNKLRLFEEILDKQAATFIDRGPIRPSPEEKFMWFVLDLGGSVIPAALILATFPRFPLPILPVIVVVSFLATRYFSRKERPGKLP